MCIQTVFFFFDNFFARFKKNHDKCCLGRYVDIGVVWGGGEYIHYLFIIQFFFFLVNRDQLGIVFRIRWFIFICIQV